VGNDTGPGVRIEKAGIEVDQAAERGEPELTGLEDDVGRMQIVEQRKLGGVGPERNLLSGLVGDCVKVRQAYQAFWARLRTIPCASSCSK
jgi:hypothetical protein